LLRVSALADREWERSMAPRGAEPRPSSPSGAFQDDRARVASNQTFVLIAERELANALAIRVRSSLGMYVQPSRAETAALERAVHMICREAHRLDLRAEELVIGIKQAWFQLAPIRITHLGERDGDVLQEVVSSSIEVFFESREMESL
jgi:hypothetical protein